MKKLFEKIVFTNTNRRMCYLNSHPQITTRGKQYLWGLRNTYVRKYVHKTCASSDKVDIKFLACYLLVHYARQFLQLTQSLY